MWYRRTPSRGRTVFAKRKLRSTCCVWLLVVVVTAGICGQVLPTPSDLPSDQKVLAFLTESIDWYRHRAVEEQVATEPADLVFLENNHPVTTQIVQLSFDFARAEASLSTTLRAANRTANASFAGSSTAELAHFAALESKVDFATQQARQDLDTTKKRLAIAHGAERKTLQAALDVSQRRLEVLEASLASLRDLVDFVQVTTGRQSDLASSIEDLARTVPTAATSRQQNREVASSAKPRDSGILGLSSDVSRLVRKLRILDDEIQRTDKLRQLSSDVRSPLLTYANRSLPITTDNDVQASDASVLEQQKVQLDELISVAKALAPAIVALDKQNVLLTVYISRLKTWRTTVQHENEKTWRSLIFRLVGVAAGIGALLLIAAAARKLTDRYVQELERHHVLRVAERVAPWIMIVLLVAFSFTSDLTSLATFFGLLTAGVAIALQNVIVSALGYFLLVGKRGIRTGDRVQISGIIGDVADIGWLQFQIREIDKQTQQSTGNVITFPNSLVLASGGVGKFNRKYLRSAQLEATGTGGHK